MRGFLLKVPALVCVAVYLMIGWHYLDAMMTATTRNFNILFVVPCLLGAVLFLLYGLLLSEEMPPRSSVKVGLLNLGISLLPYMLLAMLLSPRILLTLPAESWKNCILPMVLSLCPFGIALWRKATQKSEKI